jgi:HTH-type transcriptional regulator/antitoxin HigA
MMQTLKTEIDYQHALQRLELIFDAPKNSPEDNELEALSLLVYQYEQENYAIDMPNLVEAIKFRMEQLDITQQDFANAINLSNIEVSKIFKNKDNISKKNTILLETTLNSDVFWESLQAKVEAEIIRIYCYQK